ncbi:MAG: trypsin-like peptidase domain-containing protein [Candidatus Nitrosopolaris sp.]
MKTYIHALIIPLVAVITIFVTSQIIFHSVTWASNGSSIRKIDLNVSNILTLQSLALNRIFNNVEGSVVEISHPVNQSISVYGSGFIYNKQGYIVTNNHVVNGTDTVDVTFTDGNIYTAKVIGTDPFNDIGVIEIVDDFSSEHIVPLILGNSSNVRVGQLAIAVGNPLGSLTDSMTLGIISQVGRLFPAGAGVFGGLGGFSEADIIQTDALINPGNSGGPLLDMQGQVIGMNTFTAEPGGLPTGIGFAIPSNSIQRIVPALIQNGSYSHPWLGLYGDSLNPDTSQSFGLPRTFKGVLVTYVDPEGPSSRAGLLASGLDIQQHITSLGDIIVGIDGHPVKRMDDIIAYIEEHKSIGESTKLTIIRNGDAINLTVVLQARPRISGA